MFRCAALILAMAMMLVSGCGGDEGGGDTPAPCDPAVDSERCVGNTSRQVCSEETSTWTTTETCATNYLCEESGSGTTCVYVDPTACESDDDCPSGTCVGGKCLNDHCNDGELNGDELYVDCGGSCPLGCPDGRPCESNKGCESGCCSSDGVCAQGDGYGPQCMCKNPNAGGPACDECLGPWEGAMCEICPSSMTGEDCDRCIGMGEFMGTWCACPSNWDGYGDGMACSKCSNQWTGEACDVCPENWAGDNCNVCSGGWTGEAGDSCPDIQTGCYLAGVTPSTSHCESPVSDEVLGTTVPWTGFVCEDTVYHCNRCPGGDTRLVGTWRHIHGGTEDPDTPVDDDYRERLVFDGNTWSKHSTGFDIVLGKSLTVDVAGWYFCGDKPEIDNKATVFMADSVSYEGGFGWVSGVVFSAETLKDGSDKLLLRSRVGLNQGAYTDDIYCRIGTEIETLAGETKACTNPF